MTLTGNWFYVTVTLILIRSILTGTILALPVMGCGENSYPEKMIALIAPNGYKKKPNESAAG
jgi:hypothetical protein